MVANLVAMLASDAAGGITGQTLGVDGGQVIDGSAATALLPILGEPSLLRVVAKHQHRREAPNPVAGLHRLAGPAGAGALRGAGHLGVEHFEVDAQGEATPLSGRCTAPKVNPRRASRPNSNPHRGDHVLRAVARAVHALSHLAPSAHCEERTACDEELSERPFHHRGDVPERES